MKSILTTRRRIEQIKDRTDNTILPKLNSTYATHGKISTELSKDIVDRMTFSTFPNADEDGTAAIAAFLMNSYNLDCLKTSGTLGSVIELLRRGNIKENVKSPHIENLLISLHTLCINNGIGDEIILSRLLCNPNAIKVVLELVKYTSGKSQIRAMELLIAISKVEGGVHVLIKNNVFGTIVTSELLYRRSTIESVKHNAAALINRLCALSPKDFPLDRVLEHTLDDIGEPRIDAYMEIQILNGFLQYLTWLNDNKKVMPRLFSMLPYLIDEIKSENFDSLDHLQLIVKCCVGLSQDPKHVEYMLTNGLSAALQYLVRTDLTLYRKKQKGTGVSKNMLDKLKAIKYKRTGIQDTGERPIQTLVALSIIKPPGNAKDNRSDDINFTTIRSAIIMFENIIELRFDYIENITSSGIIPALIFRVGSGNDMDTRFNKVLVNFICNIFKKVLAKLNCKATMATSMVVENKGFVHLGELFSPSASVATVEIDNKKEYAVDMRTMTNTMHVQGVTKLFCSSLSMDDPEVVQQSLYTLSIMSFEIVMDDLIKDENFDRIIFLLSTRQDCFSPGLSLTCDLVCSPIMNEEILTRVMMQTKIIKQFIKSLKLSGWIFHFKGTVFKALSKFAYHPKFRLQLIEANGLSTVVTETKKRKKQLQTDRRARTNMDDDSTEIMMNILKQDIASATIQAHIRVKLANLRIRKLKTLGK